MIFVNILIVIVYLLIGFGVSFIAFKVFDIINTPLVIMISWPFCLALFILFCFIALVLGLDDWMIYLFNGRK